MMKTEHKRYLRLLTRFLFLTYMVVLIYLLFISETMGRSVVKETYTYNLIPFKEISRYFHNIGTIGFRNFVINIFGNVLAFVPFGLFYPMMATSAKHKNFGRVMSLGIVLTVSVELIQLVTRVGSCDIDDVILNTIGTFLGYLCYRSERVIRDRYVERRRKEEKSIGKTGFSGKSIRGEAV